MPHPRPPSGSPLAAKPTSQHLLRCKWGDDVRFPPRRALGLAAAVADALRYCHAAGICHGDVYAHNVLMDENGTVTLCDFGERARERGGGKGSCGLQARGGGAKG